MINKQEITGFKHVNGSKAFIECANVWMIFIKTLKNPNKKRKILIAFDDMIADMLSNKKLNSIVNELFRDRKLNISLVFIKQSYSAVPKNIRLNSAHYFIMKNSK